MNMNLRTPPPPFALGSMLTDAPKRHCKIVGTLGPSSSSPEVLEEIVKAGLDVVRLNFSHGSHEQHLTNLRTVREIAKKLGKNIAILQDLQGPKIRCGQVLDGKIQIQKGEEYVLRYGKTQTEPQVIPIDYDALASDVKAGQRVMMDDGLLILVVTKVTGQDLHVRVLEGGMLKSRKGVNFPDAKLSLPAMTEKDTQDLLFGVSQGVDFVALSFVQDPKDIDMCKKMIRALGADTPVIAKIEMLQAIKNIDEIARISDGLMVARGDLGVEASVERVPNFQRQIIDAAQKYNKPVIIATQMLESMIENPRATLAEVTDVANGVLDGADALMLSGEMASGKYPVKCVEKMEQIIRDVESWSLKRGISTRDSQQGGKWADHESVAIAACEAAESLNARAIICLTLTGSIARSMAKWRPRVPIIAISPRSEIVYRMSLIWGVYGLQNPLFYNTDVLIQELPGLLKTMGLVCSGDYIVITAGIPMNSMNPTNMVKINQII